MSKRCPVGGLVELVSDFLEPAWDVECSACGRLATQVDRFDAYAIAGAHLDQEGGQQ